MLEREHNQSDLDVRGGIKLPKPTGTCVDWIAYFDKQFARSKVYNAFGVEELYNRAWRQLNQLADDWEPTVRGIYDILVVLYLRQLCDSLAESKTGVQEFFYNAGYFFSKITRHSHNQLTTVLGEIDAGKAQLKYMAHLKELAAYVAAQSAKEASYSNWNWFEISKLLWSGLLNEKSLIADELVRLRKTAADSSRGRDVSGAAIKALAHFDLLSGDDENAWDRIASELREIDPADWFGYLRAFVREQQWDRLLKWLGWLGPVIREKAQDYGEEYLDLWQEAAKFVEVERAFKEAMVSLLPSSYRHYSRFLLEKEEYQAWADMHLLLGYTPAYMDSAQLKKVEQADIRVLLPIYHYAIDYWMRERNRLGYKEAVKLLRKLAAAYKKLKIMPRFDRYLDGLIKQNSRYRAFQEELRKGKLLT